MSLKPRVALLACIISVIELAAGISTAPGDEEPLCQWLRDSGTAPTPNYAPNMRILMDSWNYQNLLPERTGSVWEQVDNDANNPMYMTTTWIQNSNTPCQQAAQVCGFFAGAQDNWLITQLINRTVNGTRLSTVSVQIEFELQGCETTLNCQRTFNTHVYETTSTDNAVRRNITNYRQAERVSTNTDTGERVNETVAVDFETTEPTFYFAVQDETSCIVITRIIVFYHVCPSQTFNLISTPEIIAPPYGAPLILVTATCAGSAERKGDSDPKLVCSTDGIWLAVRNSGCRCQPGLGLINGTCLPLNRVTFEQVCQGLDNVTAYANANALSPCTRDSNCTMVTCGVTGVASFFIYQLALTILPCHDPPSVQFQLWNPSMQVLIDQVFNQTRTVAVNTAGGPLPVTFYLNQTTNTEIGIMIEYNLLTVQPLINFTSVPVDTSTCIQPAISSYVALSSSLNDTSAAYPQQVINFTCVTRGSPILAWNSDDYIGVGARFQFVSVHPLGTAIQSIVNPDTVAILVNVSMENDETVLKSTLQIIVSSQFSSSSVACHNDSGGINSITFHTIPATTVTSPPTTTTAATQPTTIPAAITTAPPLVLTPPSEVEVHCSYVNWRNSPDVSCEDVSGYDVRLFNPDTGMEMIRHVDARGTFHNFLQLDKNLTEQKSTTVQIRLVSSSKEGPYSPPIKVGCFVPQPPGVYFELKGERYNNNSVVNILAIGEGDDALLCKTNKQDCCGTVPNRFGEFFYPNGIRVPIKSAGLGLYRNRGNQLIRLNRREGVSSPTGRYSCEIPDAESVTSKIFINISESEE